MWISNFAIDNRVVTTVVMLALVVFGGIALLVLDTDEFPEVNPPVISISIPYPGASPEVVERELIEPLEDAFTAISGVDTIQSRALDNFAVLIVEFVYEKDLQEASQDIRDRISEIRRDLPPEIEEPVLTRFDPQDLPIVSLTLSSTTIPVRELTRLADPGLVGALRAIPGVADVTLVGGIERELTVELNPRAMEASGVSVQQVVQALQAQNLAAPVGRVNGLYEERTIRLLGRLEKPAEFEQIAVGGAGNSLVRLGDVASVKDGTEEPRTMALFDGEPAVGIDIKKSTGFSTTAVSEQVAAKLAELKKTLPDGVALAVVRDAGVRVKASVTDVQKSLLEGAMLTVLVVFLFLASWRSTVITGLALPVSVLASFIAVWAFGFTLNTMSLLGLSLAIGILIDDAIVVRENIVRHMEMGKDHVTAAREGTAEIGLAVAATTFSIVVVFVPIAFMGGIAQQWFAPFALTIACSVLVSLFVSFSLDPMLSAVWADPEVEGGRRSWLTRRLKHFNAWLDRRTENYKKVIGWALRHRLAMALIAIGSFVGALAIPATGIIGSAFFPVQDESEFMLQIETPPGSSLEYTRTKAREVTRMAKALPEVAYAYTTLGGLTESVDEALVYIRLHPKAERERSQQAVESELRTRLSRIVGASVFLASPFFGEQKQIQVQVTGPQLERLYALADEVMAEVKKVPGAVDVGLSTRGQKPELEVEVDRELASSLGISVGQVAQALRPAFAGIDVGDWIDPEGETRDVVVRLAPEARVRPSDLSSLPLVLTPSTPSAPDDSGPRTIPLGQIAQVRQGLGPAQITHRNQSRIVTVGANAGNGLPLSAVVQGIEERIATLELPAGYQVRQGGETEDQREVFGRIMLSLATAVLLMYLILVIQFGSFLDPIPIMASLPLSLIGVMLALLVTGSTLNLMSMIGVILLMGIVAKNAILLIDFAKWSQQRGMDRQSAIIEAGGVRLRPILMTSFAIIAGMTPVAIGAGEGAEFRAPLGRAVIGGVITSTFLTLLVIPTFYDLLADYRERILRRFRKAVHRREIVVTPKPPGGPLGGERVT